MENIFLEKRKHKRYSVDDDAFAVCNNGIGQVLDISEGGMAINYVDTFDLLEEWETTFFCKSTSTKIDKLLIKQYFVCRL